MVAEVSTHVPITEETITRWDDNEETSEVSDKSCIICNKGKMSQDRLANHLDFTHEVILCRGTPTPLDDYLEADRMWHPIECGKINQVAGNKIGELGH